SATKCPGIQKDSWAFCQAGRRRLLPAEVKKPALELGDRRLVRQERKPPLDNAVDNPDQRHNTGDPANKNKGGQAAEHKPQQTPPESTNRPVEVAGIDSSGGITALQVCQRHSCNTGQTKQTAAQYGQCNQAIDDVRQLTHGQARRLFWG